MLQDSGFTDMVTGPAVDTFGGAGGEGNARAFAVYGYVFMARKTGRLTIRIAGRVSASGAP